MRRNKRGIYEDSGNYKAIILLAGVAVLIAGIIFFIIYSVYNNKIKENQLATEKVETYKISTNNLENNSTIVSTEIGKSINEIKNELLKNETSNTTTETSQSTLENTSNSNNDSNTVNKENEKMVSKTAANANNSVIPSNKSTLDNTEKKETTIEEKEPVFAKPIEGAIIREFAKENLVYSETLQEWITHLGIDIEAPKTSVVVASEAGIVESIKNDPRYGLTIIIKHDKDYKTVYSNLLTSEFVNVGDNVTKGQTLGTVGNSAAFEISDKPHLHFELIKNGEKVDPNIYIK